MSQDQDILNDYDRLLKSENETLKHELKISNDRLNALEPLEEICQEMYQILSERNKRNITEEMWWMQLRDALIKLNTEKMKRNKSP